jgi:chorismate synthase
VSGANSFGNRWVVTTFGESHGPGMGAVIDGVPAGVLWSEELLRAELARRRPGQSNVVTTRNEADEPEVLSGVYQGKTLGTPIAVVVRNRDHRSNDYAEVARNPRAGHADSAWVDKFGHSDPRGGGRSSGRETLSRVIGGAVARMFLAQAAPLLKVSGYVRQLGPYSLSEAELAAVSDGGGDVDSFVARFPSRKNEKNVESLLLRAKEEGKSYGGVAELRVIGAPSGLGQPVFHKIKAELAGAYMGIGATLGVEFGSGFKAAEAEGSAFHSETDPSQDHSRYGGMRGGLTTSEPMVARIAFKPTSSVLDVAKKGRHDPCIVPRAVPVLEAMTYLVLADHLLWSMTDRLTTR